MHRGGSMCFSNVLCNSIFVTRTRRFPFIYIRPALFDRPILHSPTPIPIISRSFKRAPMTAIDVLTSIRVKKYICAISVD